MIILDTSVWVEHLRNNPLFFPKVSSLLERNEVLAVECVFGELLQGAKTGAEKDIILRFWKHLPKSNFADIVIQAGVYSAENKLIDKGVGLIDVIILLHGIKSNSQIWTLDTRFLKIIPEGFLFTGCTNILIS